MVLGKLQAKSLKVLEYYFQKQVGIMMVKMLLIPTTALVM